MLRILSRSPLKSAALACALLLAACSPKFDWREVRGANAPFIVTLPAKPAVHTRAVDLDGIPLTMTMTAAEVDAVTFAVGSAELPDAALAPQALLAMKAALVRNIGGTVRLEKSSPPGIVPALVEIEAIGPTDANSGGHPRLLLARFLAKEQRIYQVIVVGREKDVSREAADTFFSSFKLY